MYVHMCIYIYMYVYTYTCIFSCICVYIYIPIYIYISMHEYIHAPSCFTSTRAYVLTSTFSYNLFTVPHLLQSDTN